MNDVFYKEGLRFECKRCSACCRHEPGLVLLSLNDLESLEKGLKLSRADFLNRYCRILDLSGFKRLSLREKENYDCIFWEDGSCKVYNFRPLQCRTFPFWPNYLGSAEDWQEHDCPGVGFGRLYSRKEIEEFLEKRKNDPLICPE